MQSDFRGRGGWGMLGILILGILLGILLGRFSARTGAGDLLSVLSLLVVGLAVGAGLFAAGWLHGSSRGQAPGANGGEPRALSGSEPAVSGAPVSPVSAGNEIAPGPAAAVPLPAVAKGKHFELVAGQGRAGVRLLRTLGYERLELTAGWNARWLQPASTIPGEMAAGSQWGSLGRGEIVSLVLFILALVVYGLTRVIALDRFPINFFADEAIQVTNAVDLVRHGFRDSQGGLFPVYFNVFFFTNPDISVYLHALTASLFGESIVVARATSAFLTLIAAGAAGLLVKQVFNARSWWAVVLLLAVTPVWFQHSRTAFDAAAMVAFYALFIVCYLLYRYRSPRYLYLAIVFAALTFYAYPSGQVAIAALAIFLAVADIRYHLQHKGTLLWGLVPAAILAIPFVRFELAHPNEATYHLGQVNSYWLQAVPLETKLATFAGTYLEIISPTYWFLPNTLDLARHRMLGYSFLPLVELPLLLIGLALCVRRFKESRYRTLLVALLVAPLGGALVDVGILRTLAFVIPVSLISALGLEWLVNRITRPRLASLAGAGAFALLAIMSLVMLQDALSNGPTWFTDYTLYGMQWGTKQLYQDTLPQLLADDPAATVYVSDSWANGSDIFPRFYDLSPTRVQVRGIAWWMEKKEPLPAESIFIMTPDEYGLASGSPKFQNIDVLSTIAYPDGRPGFYVAQVEYADNVDQIFDQERAALRQLVTESVVIDGQQAQVSHTRFDIGNLAAIFDGDPKTVARGVESNPLVLDIQFASPREIKKLSGYFGKANIHLFVQAYGPGGDNPTQYEQSYNYLNMTTELPAGREAPLSLENAPALISRLRIEVRYINDGENAHVHVFNISLE